MIFIKISEKLKVRKRNNVVNFAIKKPVNLSHWYYLCKILVLFTFLSSYSFANEYPSLDRKTIINSSFLSKLSGDNDFDKNPRLKIDSYFSLNLNNNWSTKTSWKLNPVKKRNSVASPERYRSFFEDKKNYSGYDFFIEQLKLEYEAEGLNISFGKINPRYGMLWNRNKDIGSVALDVIRDYEHKEKIGYQVAFLDDGLSIYFANFFNDNTDLSNSVMKKRGKEDDFASLRAGNTSTLSSYSVNIEGEEDNFINDLTYNLAYSNLDANGSVGQKDQKSFLFSLEKRILSTPFRVNGEFVQVNNILGVRGKKSRYITTAISYSNSSWTLFVSAVNKRVKYNERGNYNDNIISYGASYLLNNKYNIQATKVDLEEDGNGVEILQLELSFSF